MVNIKSKKIKSKSKKTSFLNMMWLLYRLIDWKVNSGPSPNSTTGSNLTTAQEDA